MMHECASSLLMLQQQNIASKLDPNFGCLKYHSNQHEPTLGRVQVNDKLQVVGHTNVFAVGDATDLKETKVS
jgi:hypothetical protein